MSITRRVRAHVLVSSVVLGSLLALVAQPARATADTTDPVVMITGPLDGSRWDNFTFACTGAPFDDVFQDIDACGLASDASGIDHVSVTYREVGGNYFDGSAFSLADPFDLPTTLLSSSSTGILWKTSDLVCGACGDDFVPTDGMYTITATAVDKTGRSASDSVTFEVDYSGPATAFNGPVNGSTIADTTPTFAGFGALGPTDEPNVEVRVFSGTEASCGGEPAQTLTAIRHPGTGLFSVTAAELAEGVYTATSCQGDGVSEWEYRPPATPSTFTVSSTVPAVEITWPSFGVAQQDFAFTIGGTSTGTGPVDVCVQATPVFSNSPPCPEQTPVISGNGRYQVLPTSGSWSVDVNLSTFASSAPRWFQVVAVQDGGYSSTLALQLTGPIAIVDLSAPFSIVGQDPSVYYAGDPVAAGTRSGTGDVAIDVFEGWAARGAPLLQLTTPVVDGTFSEPLPGLGDGVFTVRAQGIGATAGGDAITFGHDADAPRNAVRFPAAGALYRAATWNAGCAGVSGQVCGFSTDAGSGVGFVSVSIRRNSDDASWNGGTWTVPGGSALTAPDGKKLWAAFPCDVGTCTQPGGGRSWVSALTSSAFGLVDAVFTLYVRSGDRGVQGGAPHERWTSSSFAYDGIVPNVPVISTPAIDAFLNDTMVTIAGTAEVGSSLAISIDNSPADPIVVADGTFSLDIAGLAEGPHSVTVTATDPAGNTSLASSRSFTIDRTPPNTSILSGPASITRQTSASFTFSSSEPDATFACSLDGATATPCASPRELSALAEGAHAFSVAATDLAENADTSPASYEWTVDLSGPSAPTITSPIDGSIASVRTPTITGQIAEGSVSVEVRIDDGTWAAASVSGTSYAFTPSVALADGTHVVRARATDEIGNTSESGDVSFTIDTVAPTPPVVLEPAQPRFNVATVRIGGTAESGATLTLSEFDATFATTAVSGGGTWSIERSFAEGQHQVAARASDAAGNVSPPTSVVFTIDQTPPTAPILDAPGANAILPPGPAIIRGRTEPDARVAVREGTQLLGEVTATDGSFQLEVVFSAGTHAITATATDATGNSGGSSSRTFTVRSDAPPVVQEPTPGEVIPSNVVVVSGLAPVGAEVTILEEEEERSSASSRPSAASSAPRILARVIAPVSGRWEVTLTLPPGVHTIFAETRAANGDVARSAPISFTVRSDRPFITSPTAGAIVGPSVTVVGTAPAGRPVTVLEGETSLGSVMSDTEGRWTITRQFADGSHTVHAVGGSGPDRTPASQVATFRVDATAPVVTISTETNGFFGSLFGAPRIEGNASDEAAGVARIVVVYTNRITGNRVEAELCGGDCPAGSVSFRDEPSLGVGYWIAEVRATDAVGNLGPTDSIGFFVLP